MSLRPADGSKAFLLQNLMITGLKIKNYRSFDNEWVDIDGLKKINIFLGKNNSGKSNVLRFLSHLGKNLPLSVTEAMKAGLQTVDYYNQDPNNIIEFRIDFESPSIPNISPIKVSEFYLTYKVEGSPPKTRLQLIDSFVHSADEQQVRSFVQKRKGVDASDFKHMLQLALADIRPDQVLCLPNISFLDEFRQLLNNDKLKESLNQILHYDHKTQQNKKKREGLLTFLNSILKESVEINIPTSQPEIELIMQGGRHLPLSSFGTGIHHVILLGMHLATTEKSIFCIDEPELHLHPSFQKDFLKFISDSTEHQYFIATHSNSFLDFEVENKEIFSVRLENNKTLILRCTGIGKVAEVLSDIGVRASEILQTNGIIWVEGPSDRIYIKRWLELHSPDLREGYHFSFQYYGGRMLSHYSVDDMSLNEFLNLLLVNRNSFIVMDSDMDKEFVEEDLGKTKKRIIEECKKADVSYWVTAGREIENYLSSGILTSYCGNHISVKQYDKIETYCNKYNSSEKVQFAQDIRDLMKENEIKSSYDLPKKLDELAESIKRWNE